MLDFLYALVRSIIARINNQSKKVLYQKPQQVPVLTDGLDPAYMHFLPGCSSHRGVSAEGIF
jgi:hypothetical protein